MQNAVAKDTTYEWGLSHGPIQSPRFGNHVEVNPLGQEKVCSFDCPYCNLGPSYMRMNQIKKEYEFPSIAEIEESTRMTLRAARANNENLNTILVSGNGDPSLYPNLAELYDMLSNVRDDIYPDASIEILTNGAKIDTRKSIDAMNKFEKIHIKLDAGSDKVLKQINTPLVRTTISQIVSTARKLENVVIQSLFVQGIMDNTTDSEVEEWVESISLVEPKEVHIYTLQQDPQVPGIKKADENRLYFISSILERKKKIKTLVVP